MKMCPGLFGGLFASGLKISQVGILIAQLSEELKDEL